MGGVLQEARILEKFANIKEGAPPGSELSPDYFRNNHPGFVPVTWWLGKDSPDDYVWKEALAILQVAWQDGFSTESSVRVIALPTDWRIQATEQIMEAGPENAELPEGFDLDLSKKMKVWPFQKAVMFLATERWRARVCAWCGNKFVAAKQRSTYCSSSCSEKAYPARYRKYNLKRKLKRGKRK